MSSSKNKLKKKSIKWGYFIVRKKHSWGRNMHKKQRHFVHVLKKVKKSVAVKESIIANLSTQPLEMANKNNQPPVEGNEVILEEIQEEVAILKNGDR